MANQVTLDRHLVEALLRSSEKLVQHDEAAAVRKGIPNCIEIDAVKRDVSVVREFVPDPIQEMLNQTELVTLNAYAVGEVVTMYNVAQCGIVLASDELWTVVKFEDTSEAKLLTVDARSSGFLHVCLNGVNIG